MEAVFDTYEVPAEERPASTVTYAETRYWFRILDTFTAADVANAMAADLGEGRRAIRAGLWHGIIEPLGVTLPTVDGEELEVYRYTPLPPGPSEHWTGVPEWKATPGCYDLAPIRGLPVRLVDNTDRRNQMQGTGGARIRIKQRDKAFEAMQEANRKRAEKNKMKERARHEGKGFKLKDAS